MVGWKEAEGPIAILWKHLVTSKASAVTATDADEGLQFLDLPATHGSLHVEPRGRWSDTFIGAPRQACNGTSPDAWG